MGILVLLNNFLQHLSSPHELIPIASLVLTVVAVTISYRSVRQQPKLHEALRRQKGIDALDAICDDIAEASVIELNIPNLDGYFRSKLDIIDSVKEQRALSEALRCLWQVHERVDEHAKALINILLQVRLLLKELQGGREHHRLVDAHSKFAGAVQPLVAQAQTVQITLRVLGQELFKDAIGGR